MAESAALQVRSCDSSTSGRADSEFSVSTGAVAPRERIAWPGTPRSIVRAGV
jgi:hypothetical protein